ncbi:NUDIX domain-containing protein [Rathayibacter toxicus]|uniref:GDP-mannose pyrophosphatase n=1 Tax=Rathayibacter toxicus TaxID=145458 RepID=A0A0C5BU16_9MICO|nr:NUDIX domain-containing protein [Rathayibacter toxicus]AJM78152.1 GDP-mannose pyrophosphatase [Rathayibacter toxicus]ALS57582.1 GDP-mannose pyrophosphatase [Rathayibacter toxicus]KKM44938.1 GDP-mannose pyrophosphatase [Rathayibacter toxicus]PPG20750.1 NUDIX domain-containing protein [Rathayibacter toxicus]PPG45853.1 NUDIX domain-containing protein [Rathayibacter toxicus]
MTVGIDQPDRRGRSRLDREGLDLTGNPDVVVKEVTLLSHNWYVLRSTRFEYRHRDGRWTTEHRETYDRGNGAAVLLYDIDARTIVLVRQFRYPTYVNGNIDGMLLEVPAGLLDEDSPEDGARREAAEETGVEVGSLEHVFDAYMSPGSVTEKLHFYAGPYQAGSHDGTQAGLADEGEDTEIIELPFDEALTHIGAQIIDAKTIMLLHWAALNGPFSH